MLLIKATYVYFHSVLFFRMQFLEALINESANLKISKRKCVVISDAHGAGIDVAVRNTTLVKELK